MEEFYLLVKHEEDQTVTISKVTTYEENGDSVYSYKEIKEVLISELDEETQEKLKTAKSVRQDQFQ